MARKPTRSLVKHNVAPPILAKLKASSYDLGVKWKTRSAECGARSVENAECGICGV